MAESDDDERCELCRFHPPEGLHKHGYTKRHQKCVTQRFIPFLKKIDEVRKDLKKPRVEDGEIASDNFWCHPCACQVEKHISDGESSIVNGGTLTHIGSEEHATKSKKFCQRHGIFLVEKDALSRLILDNTLLVGYMELVQEATEKLQTVQVRSQEAKYIAAVETARLEISKQPAIPAVSSQACAMAAVPEYRTVSNSHGIVQNPTGWHDGQRVWGGGIVKYGADSDQRVVWRIDRLQQARMQQSPRTLTSAAVATSYESEVVTAAAAAASGLTALSKPIVQRMRGNMHTGATPPWLLDDGDSSQASQTTAIGPSLQEFERHAFRSQFEGRYPKRVGADHVRAILRRYGSDGSGLQEATAASSDPMWLPSFGRVHNYGSRLDTKKEFFKELRHNVGKRKRKR